jgi:hypothetical protein
MFVDQSDAETMQSAIDAVLTFQTRNVGGWNCIDKINRAGQKCCNPCSIIGDKADLSPK